MKLLLAEDDRVVRITVRDALVRAGFAVTECADGTSALRAVTHELFDLVLTDVRLPGLSGLELFRQVRQTQPSAAVVLMTAWANTEDAVAVMREGARDYITKPFEIEELVLRLARVRHEVELRLHFEAGGNPAGRRAAHEVKGASPATRRLLERIEVAAATDVGVLITGETGTGKDLCARTIHQRSRRGAKQFVAINCAAIPENLLEAELFGHEKGAFTGADRKRVGRFMAANGGTLFLDEVGDLPLAHQAKLLRVIDDGTLEPLGSDATTRVDVRIIAATNSNLEAAVEQKRFRRDLYFRLNAIEVETPPLRERSADIPELVADFLADLSVRNQRAIPSVDPQAFSLLMLHHYPGNMRELIHALEHAVALSRGKPIAPEHLPRAFAAGGAPVTRDCGDSLALIVEQFERQYIKQVLARVGGRRAEAASLLGISRKALWHRLRHEPK